MPTLADRWLRTLPGLGDPKLRVAYAKHELYTNPVGDAAAALDEVCRRAEVSDLPSRDALLAIVPVVIDPAHIDRIWSIRATAVAGRMLAVSRLLRCSTPEGHLLDRERVGAPPTDLQHPDGRPLTLGERRALARQPTRKMIDKLVKDPHPMVVRILLENPRITEEDVVRMAAHRPPVPEVIGEIGKTWAHRARVRMTVILNPGSPTAVSVPMLVLLVRPELDAVAHAADLPAAVRATALDLYDLRPPMPPVEEPVVKH